jgi:hypothetical protein
MALRVESQRGSVGAMKCTSGMRRSEASSTSESSAWTNACRRSLQPRSMIQVKTRLRVSVQRIRSAGRPRPTAIRIARSIATST